MELGAMKSCCDQEARKSLKRHRDVATCDACGALLLAYQNESDYEYTLAELAKHGIDAETATYGTLSVIAKPKSSDSIP